MFWTNLWLFCIAFDMAALCSILRNNAKIKADRRKRYSDARP